MLFLELIKRFCFQGSSSMIGLKSCKGQWPHSTGLLVISITGERDKPCGERVMQEQTETQRSIAGTRTHILTR